MLKYIFHKAQKRRQGKKKLVLHPLIRTTSFFFIWVLFSTAHCDSNLSPLISSIENPKWKLVFQDDFNGTQLDAAKWDTAPRWGRVDPKGNELQFYAEDAFEFSNGILRIKADQKKRAGQQYTSGLIESSFKFTQAYGKFEIRAKVPAGQGLWSGFWLVPERRWPPEIDVFEYLGHESTTMFLSQHWADANGNHDSVTESYKGPNFSQAFHTYAVEWTPTEIIWYIDGVECFRSNEHIPSEPMFITANLAVGGKWPGNPNSSTPFPSYLEIDYIRVYVESALG